MAQLAKMLNPSFKRDVLSASVSLRKYFELPVSEHSLNVDSSYAVPRANGSDFMREVLDEDCVTDSFGDEVIFCLKHCNRR